MAVAIGRDLVAATSVVTGLRLTTVETHLRNLREAGLISRSGRGPSAAPMRVSDAIALLFAVLGSAWVKDSEQTYRACSQLTVHGKAQQLRVKTYSPLGVPPRSTRDVREEPKLGLLHDMPAGHTLEAAFRRLFDVAQQEIDRAARRRLGLPTTGDPVLWAEGVEVDFLMPGNRFVADDGSVVGRVTIRLKRPRFGDVEEATYGGFMEPWFRRGRHEVPVRPREFDLLTHRSITHHTFLRLIECLTTTTSGA